MPDPEYIIESARGDSEVVFSFKGHFQHRPVVWHVRLLSCRAGRQSSSASHGIMRQFIEIEKGRQPGHYHAHICLNIPRIDHAAILKTMIMLRQYKNLAVGRHEYGDPLQ